VDDPLWELNSISYDGEEDLVLIPLLVDDPLWDKRFKFEYDNKLWVLIPLLVDDPLWEIIIIILE